MLVVRWFINILHDTIHHVCFQLNRFKLLKLSKNMKTPWKSIGKIYLKTGKRKLARNSEESVNRGNRLIWGTRKSDYCTGFHLLQSYHDTVGFCQIFRHLVKRRSPSWRSLGSFFLLFWCLLEVCTISYHNVYV